MDITNITQKDDKELEKLRTKLSGLYDRIPDTVGCMENINREGGCGAWCCQSQSPQVLYSEFCNAWRYINKHWSKQEVLELVLRAVRNYLSNKFAKGCVFWSQETKLCQIHDARPLACRVYGVMPDEEWKPKYERLKVLYPDEVREQCGLIKTEDGKPVTKAQTDVWWKLLTDIEASQGIARNRMHDGPSGTYRTFHDHIVLSLYDRKILTILSEMRLNASEEAKEKFIAEIRAMYEKQTVRRSTDVNEQPEAAKTVDVKPDPPAGEGEGRADGV
jgi:Fe-S-cluster containining protein